MNNLLVSIQKLEHSQDLPLPFYATLHSAGMDLMAALGESVVIVLEPMQRALIPTGIAIALPIGYEAQVRPRSGLAFKHGITVANAPGTIDSDYRGEIFVPLINFSQDSFKVAHGMRIAQLVIARHERVNWNLAKSLEESARGDGGFGSTGV